MKIVHDLVDLNTGLLSSGSKKDKKKSHTLLMSLSVVIYKVLKCSKNNLTDIEEKTIKLVIKDSSRKDFYLDEFKTYCRDQKDSGDTVMRFGDLFIELKTTYLL